jgi:hypothetical protein
LDLQEEVIRVPSHATCADKAPCTPPPLVVRITHYVLPFLEIRMRAYRSVLLTLSFLLTACTAQMPVTTGSFLASMQRESVDSENITLGPGTLKLLGYMSRLGGEHDPHSAAATDLLRGLHKVQIRSFKFATDHIYRRMDIEQLTSKLIAPDWRHVVQVRDGRTNEYVDVYCALKDYKITGLVIVAAQPREFTLVNVVGTLDPGQLAMLGHGIVAHTTIGQNSRSLNGMGTFHAKSADRGP